MADTRPETCEGYRVVYVPAPEPAGQIDHEARTVTVRDTCPPDLRDVVLGAAARFIQAHQAANPQ